MSTSTVNTSRAELDAQRVSDQWWNMPRIARELEVKRNTVDTWRAQYLRDAKPGPTALPPPDGVLLRGVYYTPDPTGWTATYPGGATEDVPFEDVPAITQPGDTKQGRQPGSPVWRARTIVAWAEQHRLLLEVYDTAGRWTLAPQSRRHTGRKPLLDVRRNRATP